MRPKRVTDAESKHILGAMKGALCHFCNHQEQAEEHYTFALKWGETCFMYFVSCSPCKTSADNISTPGPTILFTLKFEKRIIV